MATCSNDNQEIVNVMSGNVAGKPATRRVGSSGMSRSLAGMAAVALAVLTLLAAGVATAEAGTVWAIDMRHGPTNFIPGGQGQYVIETQNIGDENASGTVVTLTLPEGVTGASFDGLLWSCTATGGGTLVGASSIRCTTIWPLAPRALAPADSNGFNRALRVNVDIAPDAALGTRDTVAEIASTAATLPNGDACGGVGEPVCATVVDPTRFALTSAGFGVIPGAFDMGFRADPAAPLAASQQAGAHPFETVVDIDFNLTGSRVPGGGMFYSEPDEHVRTLEVKLPRGMIGNPEATPKCPMELLVRQVGSPSAQGSCPPATQVGVAQATLQNGTQIAPINLPLNATKNLALYNLVPPRGYVAAFGFSLLSRPIIIRAELDPSDNYGVKATVVAMNSTYPIRNTTLAMWGVPADPAHDMFRRDPGQDGAAGAKSPVLPKPFLTNSSECGVESSPQLRMDSWQNPGRFVTAQAAPVSVTGCDKQLFDASFVARPTTTAGDSPSGLSVDVSIPQQMSASGLGTPPLKRAVVRMPAGMSVSASSADGLQACTLAQIKLGTNDEPTCPEAAKIGSVRIDTPLLAEQLHGDVLLAAQNDNPFRTLVAMYIVARGPGVLVKLPGRVDIDPSTGALTATFDDTPQVPFSNMHLEFKTGPRAPLAMPVACGTYTMTAELWSWNAALPPVTSSSSFTVTRPNCAARFEPRFRAGTVNPTAGAATALTMTLSRDDGDEFLRGLEIQTPRGFTGTIKSIPLCPEAQAAAGACGEESRIGTVTTGAGPGTNPFFVRGRVYFTGPYKGAPFGMSIVVPAVAGPFDLGTIAVRAAVFVDRNTAELRVVSDPLPTSLQGIPLRVREVNVAVDRPGFVLNPTNCGPKRITGQVTSDTGRVANVSSSFQATDCGELDFEPRMAFTAGRRGNLRRNRTTPVTAVLTMPPGNANIRSVNVTLPYSLNARLTVVNDACTRAEYDAGNCEKARVGTAVAETPLLREPLTGAAYFVRREGESLPDIVVALRGQVDFDLVGQVKIPGGTRLGTKFTMVPDVPISRFTLNLIHGRRGSIGTAENLCSRAGRNRRAHIRFVGQNGKTRTLQPKMRIVGCTRATTRGLRRQRRRARARKAQALAQARAAAKAAGER